MTFTVKKSSKAFTEITKYRRSVDTRLRLLLERLSALGAYRARIEFTNAMYAGDNDVEVRVKQIKSGYEIEAKGRAVLFIEFGTGIINPEHPQSAELGFTHGTYGQGKGANENGWVYVGEQGSAGQTLREGVYRTCGNPPARAMYDASKDMRAVIEQIAREVFA